MAAGGRVVVGGGTGFVGRAVVRALEGRGCEAVVVSRSGGGGRVTWAELEKQGLPRGTVGIVNTAGQNVLDPLRRWGDQLKEELYSSRVATNRLLAAAAGQASTPPLALVSMSGAGYYPASRPGEPGHTEASPGGDGWMARLAADWEAAAEMPSADVPTRTVVLRAGVVLGRQGGLVQQTVLPFALGLGGRMGSGEQAMPWIHVKDLAALAVHCLFSPHCHGAYNAVAPHVVTNRQFVKAYAKTLRCVTAILN
jgi:uncharacterized protein (TIGR01777 family)